MAKRDQDVHFLASKEDGDYLEEIRRENLF